MDEGVVLAVNRPREVTMARLLVVALTVAGVATCAVVGVRAATGPATVRITDHQVYYHRFGAGVGSYEIARSALYAHGSAKRAIGHSSLICTYVAGNERSCSATFVLPKGSIVAAGELSSRLLYVLAIVGGTGLYDDARGTLTTTSTLIRPRRDVLIFRLTG